MATKLPLESSNNINVSKAPTARSRAGKTIEEMYQKKSQIEHILLRLDTYIGSIEKRTQTLWVYENGEMVNRRVTYVPGLYKIFDEILVNAADNKQRDPKMDSVKVVIDVEQNLISICNTGDGIPVEIHQEEGVYVPEMIFGHLLTSSNYDDNVKKTTGGRNGYGAKLTNIFSTEFTIETADGKRQKKYKQVFENNMGKKSEPVITKCNKSDNWTKVSFKPDLEKFGMTHLEDDVVALMSKRVFDIAGCLGKTVKVELNGELIPIKSFTDYVDLYLTAANKSWNRPVPRMVEKVNDRWEVCVSTSEGQFQQVSFVNSIATIKGGTHVDYVTNQITNYIVGILNKKNKTTANFTTHHVKHQLWVFVNSLIDNPAFDSQTKEKLTLRKSSFGSKCELSEDILKKVAKSGVVENLLSWATFNQEKELRKSDGTKTDRVQVEKLDDAKKAGGKESENCTLILTEGDSAKTLAKVNVKNLQRSIPSMVDGLQPCQRKILFCSFKRNFVKDLKVAKFSGYVSEHSAYHHGEQSLASTIIGMAQDYVGSNNINLLQPNGQFGTRNTGGKDAASARYIFTNLSPVTRVLFPKEDDCLLNYLNEDGQKIEPTWYMPIIPTVLVNGCEGIGTGWSTSIPNYNPREIVANIRRLLRGESMVPMDPWYRNFKGTIEKTASNEGGSTYTVTGVYEEIDETTLRVTELPIRRWTDDYKQFMEALKTNNNTPYFLSVGTYNDDRSVDFELQLSEKNMMMARKEGFLKLLKLTTTIGTTNMHLFDENGVIKKYTTPEQILEEFFQLRLQYYEKRKKVNVENLELELQVLKNKVKFIQGVVRGEIIVNNRKKADLVQELSQRGFTPFPKMAQPVEAAVAGAVDSTEESEESSDVPSSSSTFIPDSEYDYLLSLAIATLTIEKMQELSKDRDKMMQSVEDLNKATSSSLWLKDLESLDAQLDKLDKEDAQAIKDSDTTQKKLRANAGVPLKGGRAAPKKQTPRKTTKKASKSDTTDASNSAMDIGDNVVEVAKPKGRQGAKKKAHAAPAPDDEEMMDQRAQYNFGSTSENRSTISLDEDIVVEVAAPAKGGRKPAAASKVAKPPAAPRKRGAAASKKQPVAEVVSVSPDKKVRKTRSSPFNKKSGSVLGRLANNNEESTETVAAGNASRPKRANRKQMRYVE